MKLGVLIFSVIIGFSTHAKTPNQIVLLTALRESEVFLEGRLAKIFSNRLKRFTNKGYRLKVIHRAQQDDLSKVLADDQNFGVFWLGHGAYSRRFGQNSGFGFKPILLDSSQRNIAPLFKKMSDSIHFVGVIGCNSNQILETLGNRFSYLPKYKVPAKMGLRRAIRRFKKSYSKTRVPIDIDQGVARSFAVARTQLDPVLSYQSLQVFLGKRYIGLMPSVVQSEFQEVEFTVNIPNGAKRSDLKVIVKTGSLDFSTTESFGLLQVLVDGDAGLWRLFAKPDGTPFGVNERVFLAKPGHPFLAEMPILKKAAL